MDGLIFLKLGGSLITDKHSDETVRPEVLTRLAHEIAAARAANPALQLLLGHGSGSFGHGPARRHGTRQGAQTPAHWYGMAEVAAAAARLNAHVVEALLAAGVPALSLPPRASAECRDGALVGLALAPLRAALAAGQLPVVMGDVAFDSVRGATIVSTEEVFDFLTLQLRPAWLLLAGDTDGVYDQHGATLPRITPGSLPAVRAALGGSAATDVTGGMQSKVLGMLDLIDRCAGLQVRILSGWRPGEVQAALTAPAHAGGTLLAAD